MATTSGAPPRTPASMVSHRVTSAEEAFFSRLGRWIGGRPKSAMGLAALVYAALTPGVFLLEGDGNVLGLPLDSDFLTTFTLTDSEEYVEYMRAQDLFPDVRSIGIIEVPTDGQSPLLAAGLRAGLSLESQVRQEVRVAREGQRYGYEQLCARSSPEAACSYLSASSLLLGANHTGKLMDLEAMEAAGTPLSTRAAWLVAGMALEQKALLPAMVGLGTVGDFPGAGADDASMGLWLSRARSLMARLDLEDSAPARAFELEVESVITEGSFAPNLRASVMTSSSLGQECTKIGISAVPLLIIAIVAMVTYVLAFLGAETRQGNDETQVLLCLLGTSIPGLSSLAALGLLGYVGMKANVLALMAPFLGLAVGVDSLFLIITSIKEAGPEEQDPGEAMSKALSRAGVATTTTTLTSVAAFSVAAVSSSNFPGFLSFNVSLVFVLALNWVGMLLLAPACAVLNERRIAAGRMDLLPCRRRRDSSRGGGVLTRISLGRRGRALIEKRMAPLLQKNLACQLIGAGLWVGLLIAAALLLPALGKGMPDRYFIVDDSPVQVYLDDLNEAFEGFAPIELGLLFEQPRMHELEYREALLSFLSGLQSRPDAIAPPDCWLAQAAANNMSVEAFLAAPGFGQAYAGDVFKPEGSLQAARCRFFVWQPSDSKERSVHAESLRAAAGAASLAVTAYHVSFPVQVARYNNIQDMILQGAGYATVAVFISLLLTLPAHLAVLALFNICAVVLVLFGYMSLAGLTCNAISYTVCVMAIGFCVDYTCHVVHFADHQIAPGTPWDERMALSIKACGFDIMHGCATAFIGVALLAFNAAVAFRLFAAMALFITGVGGLYALWGLPALISLASRLSRCGGGAKEEGGQGQEAQKDAEDFGDSFHL